MKKRLLAVLLTAAMVLGMTACGSKSNSGSSDKKEEAQSKKKKLSQPMISKSAQSSSSIGQITQIILP